jgi:hypothetical protein
VIYVDNGFFRELVARDGYDEEPGSPTPVSGDDRPPAN